MFRFILAIALIASAFADVSHIIGRPAGPSGFRPVRPVQPGPVPVGGHVVGILRQEQDVQPDGSYNYGFDTENGISVQEQGTVRQVGPEDVVKSAQGSYTYTSPEGEKVSISYVADENGYQPQGSHIPQPHPAIVKALAYIAAHPEPEQQQFKRF